MVKYGQIWSNMVKYGQILSRMATTVRTPTGSTSAAALEQQQLTTPAAAVAWIGLFARIGFRHWQWEAAHTPHASCEHLSK
jgi:phage gp37-like protein